MSAGNGAVALRNFRVSSTASMSAAAEIALPVGLLGLLAVVLSRLTVFHAYSDLINTYINHNFL